MILSLGGLGVENRNKFLKEAKLPSAKSSSQFDPGECEDTKLLRTKVL
jgi:hypothetical protein